MSNRFHNKWHRHNHSTNPTIGEPDSSHDPIASPSDPFQGSFTVNGYVSSNDVVYAGCGDSRDWCSVYSTVNPASANWNSTYNTVCANSAMWMGVTSINGLSGNVTIAPWGTNILVDTVPASNTIRISAGGGSGTPVINCCPTVCANSAMWGINSFLNFNPHVGFENENTYPLYATTNNTMYTNPRIIVYDGRDREFMFYRGFTGPLTTDGQIYKAFRHSIVSDNFILDATPLLGNDTEVIRPMKVERDWAIFLANPITAFDDVFVPAAGCRYYFYKLGSNFSTYKFPAVPDKDLTPLIAADGSASTTTVDMQYVNYGGVERIIKWVEFNQTDAASDIHKKVQMSVWDYDTLTQVGSTLTIFDDICASPVGNTLFHLDTSLNISQPYYKYLSGDGGSGVPTFKNNPNSTTRNANWGCTFKYIPEENTAFGIIYDVWNFTSSNYCHAIVSVHYDLPENTLTGGLTSLSDLFAVSPSSINIANNDAYAQIDVGGNPVAWWGKWYGGPGNLLMQPIYYPFGYDTETQIFWTNIPNNAGQTTKRIFGPINWKDPNRFIFSLSATNTIETIYWPTTVPYSGGLFAHSILLSSNLIIFPSYGKDYAQNVYSPLVTQWNSAELLPDRNLMTAITGLFAGDYNVSAFDMSMKAGTLTALQIITDGGNISLNTGLHTHIFGFERQAFSTTIDASNNITYYCWPSGLQSDTTSKSWPIYKVFAALDDTGSVIVSGVYDRNMINVRNPNNYKYFDSTTNTYISSVLSGCYVQSWAVSGDNILFLLSPTDIQNPDFVTWYGTDPYGGNWDWMYRMATFNNTTSTVTLLSTPCLSASWLYANSPSINIKQNLFASDMMVDLTDNVLYYGCGYIGATTGKKELNTYYDVLDSGKYVSRWGAVNFSALCATDFNMGKYINCLSPWADKYKIKSALGFLSEYNANDAIADIAAPKTYSQMITNIDALSSFYTNILGMKQTPGLAVFILDYPMFLNGRYYGETVGLQTIPIEQNTNTYIYIQVNPLTDNIEVDTTADPIVKQNTFSRVMIASVSANDTGIDYITYYPINGYDPGTTLDQYTQTCPVSAFVGSSTFEASATDMFLKVNVGGKEYGILLWELP